MIRSRCINTLTPTRPDRPLDEVEEDGEEEDGLAILLDRVVPLVTASSIVNVLNS